MITNLLFFPDQEMIERPRDYGLDVEEVHLVNQDQINLHGWYLPTNEPKAVLLFLHGNAGNISGRLHKAKGWIERGIAVLLLDYRGYGKSEGVIQHGEDIVDDARVGFEWLKDQKGFLPGQIILYGESLGSYPATRLAVENKVAGLVLEAPFTAFTHLAELHYPALPKPMISALLKDFEFSNEKYIPRIQTPLFVIHGTADMTCPYAHGKKLYELAPDPKKMYSVSSAGHNNLPECAGPAFWDNPSQFLLSLKA